MNLYVYTPIGHNGNSYTVMAETQQQAYEIVLDVIRRHPGETGYNETEFMSHSYELSILNQFEVGITPYAA